jgi:hypothetical protein
LFGFFSWKLAMVQLSMGGCWWNLWLGARKNLFNELHFLN